MSFLAKEANVGVKGGALCENKKRAKPVNLKTNAKLKKEGESFSSTSLLSPSGGLEILGGWVFVLDVIRGLKRRKLLQDGHIATVTYGLGICRFDRTIVVRDKTKRDVNASHYGGATPLNVAMELKNEAVVDALDL